MCGERIGRPVATCGDGTAEPVRGQGGPTCFWDVHGFIGLDGTIDAFGSCLMKRTVRHKFFAGDDRDACITRYYSRRADPPSTYHSLDTLLRRRGLPRRTYRNCLI